jgi:blue copper oxidase
MYNEGNKRVRKEGRIKMSRRTSLIVALVASLALLLFVSANLFSTFFNSGDNRVTTIDTDSSSTGNLSGMGHMMGGEQSVVLDESGQPMTALQLPELLEPDSNPLAKSPIRSQRKRGKLPFGRGNDANARIQRFLSWSGFGRA